MVSESYKGERKSTNNFLHWFCFACKLREQEKFTSKKNKREQGECAKSSFASLVYNHTCKHIINTEDNQIRFVIKVYVTIFYEVSMLINHFPK